MTQSLFIVTYSIILYLVPSLLFVSMWASDFAHDLNLPKPLTEADYRPFNPKRAALGQLLFYDRLLSGNQNIACSTCHHHNLASGDALSLGIGEGGIGLGKQRKSGQGNSRAKRRIQRNAPALFNLGHRSIHTLFHDGRLQIDPNDKTGFNSPAVEFLPSGLQSIVAAQAVFPLVSEVEMAGHIDENEVAGARNRRIDYAWDILTQRVRRVSAYTEAFTAAFDEIKQPSDIQIQHIANALDDFMNSEWRSLNSPFDHYLHGNKTALNPQQLRGMQLFYGEAQCSTCHNGSLHTDQQFYSLGLPQLGPGRTRLFDFKARDMGRINETDKRADRYRFRTPSLRNVEHTAPYGHNGVYKDLIGIIKHHLQPLQALDSWSATQLILPEFSEVKPDDLIIHSDRQEQHRLRQSIDIKPITLSQSAIDDLIAFLHSLTDSYSLSGRLGIPPTVPSQLPLDQ